jgi:hypothetical protein
MRLLALIIGLFFLASAFHAPHRTAQSGALQDLQAQTFALEPSLRFGPLAEPMAERDTSDAGSTTQTRLFDPSAWTISDAVAQVIPLDACHPRDENTPRAPPVLHKSVCA